MSIFVQSFITTFDVDYPDKSEIMNLSLCLAIKHHPRHCEKLVWWILLWPTLTQRRGPWRSSKNSRCVSEHWCRAWIDNASVHVQPWLGNQWLLFIKKKSCGQRFSSPEDTLQKPCFGGVSIGVEKQTQMMVVHQNILSSVMLKNIKLFYGNVRFQLATPEIC